MDVPNICSMDVFNIVKLALDYFLIQKDAK